MGQIKWGPPAPHLIEWTCQRASVEEGCLPAWAEVGVSQRLGAPEALQAAQPTQSSYSSQPGRHRASEYFSSGKKIRDLEWQNFYSIKGILQMIQMMKVKHLYSYRNRPGRLRDPSGITQLMMAWECWEAASHLLGETHLNILVTRAVLLLMWSEDT